MKPSQAVFIIGYPRSGTKLLRDLLNNHPDISLGEEGYFIRNLINRFGLETDVSDPKRWPEIYQVFTNTAAYSIEANKGNVLSEADFLQRLEQHSKTAPVTWADIFETLFRAYGFNPEARIFGDKSHGYISSVPLLRNIFDNVRFILIVRDPRDQALSVLRTWGRNPLRSAQGWFRMASKADEYGLESAPDTLTVRYEDLTADTDKELQRVCAFLEVPYLPEIAVLKKSVEAKKHRKQELSAVVNQPAQYKQAFSPETIREISEITLPYLARYGYPTEGATRHHELGNLRLQWLKYNDGFASLRYHMRQKGIIKGFNYYRKRHFDG